MMMMTHRPEITPDEPKEQSPWPWPPKHAAQELLCLAHSDREEDVREGRMPQIDATRLRPVSGTPWCWPPRLR